MGLYERLTWEQEPHFSAHAFQAAVAEVLRGKTTVATAQAFFGLSASELTEVQTLVARIQSTGMKSDEVDQIFLLADARFPGYNTATTLKSRFGIV